MENITKKVFRANVSLVEEVTKEVKRITFNINGIFSFVSGQYVWVELPNLSLAEDPKGNRRAFSISNSSNGNNTIYIIARTSTSGYKNKLFSLKIGEEVNIHGPFGSAFVLPENPKKNIMMIGGGVGITPFVSVIEGIKQESLSIKLFLFQLSKKKEIEVASQRLEEFKKVYKFFDFKTQDRLFSWNDVKNIYKSLAGETEWWVFGPKGMVDLVYRELKRGGIFDSDMIFENYYPTLKNSLSLSTIKKYITSDLLLQAIQDSTNHTVITDINGVVLFANQAAQNITGYSEKEILGNTPRLWGGLLDASFYERLWKEILSGKPFISEIKNRRRNGEIYYAIAHISPIVNKKKQIIGFIGNEEDITVQKKQAEELEKGKVKNESILSSIGDALLVVDVNGLIEIVNPEAEKMFGYKAGEIIGKSVFEVMPIENERRICAEREKATFYCVFRKKNSQCDL